MRNFILVFLIKLYRKWISPLLPPACRFVPSCSEYAMECFRSFSCPKAFWLTMKRLSKCHPYCKGGFDPIPGSGDRPVAPTI